MKQLSLGALLFVSSCTNGSTELISTIWDNLCEPKMERQEVFSVDGVTGRLHYNPDAVMPVNCKSYDLAQITFDVDGEKYFAKYSVNSQGEKTAHVAGPYNFDKKVVSATCPMLYSSFHCNHSTKVDFNGVSDKSNINLDFFENLANIGLKQLK